MAYNFPTGYQPYYPQYSPQNNSSIIWVQGEAGAKSYLVAPNNTVQLWDSESQTIYLKSADASGMPSMRILDYTLRDTAPQNVPAAFSKSSEEIPTKKDITALQEQIDALRAEIGGLKNAE